MDELPPPSSAAADRDAFEGDDLGKLAEIVFQQVIESIPGVTVRSADPQEDAGVSDVEKPLAIDVVGAVPDRHAFVAQVTTSSMREKQQKMLQHTRDMPFVPTRRLVDHDRYPEDPPLVPRINIRIENGLMQKYAVDKDVSKHPEIRAVVREQLLANIAMHEARMTMDERGKPLPPAQAQRVRQSDAFRQLAELKTLFSSVAQ